MTMLSLFRCGAAACAILAATACAASTPAPPPQAPAAPQARWVHEIDLVKMVPPFLSPQGFMDPEFSASLAEPSPILTDFFGSQAIADVSAADIRRDFVPKLATLVSADEHSLTLRFPKGYTATFYPQSSLNVKGAIVPVSHVTVTGEGWRGIRGNAADLIATIQRAGLGKRYLLPNPFYREEVQVAQQMKSGRSATVVVDPELTRYDAAADAILLFPEGVHGNSKDADRLMTVLAQHKVNWLSLEMMTPENQRDLDAFNAAAAGTPAYAAARAKLVAYFADAWNGRAGPKTTGEENYYFKLVEAAHARGVKVYGVEASSLPYLIFRYGETPFGAAVRSLLWVRNSPVKGRGVIFGGSAHFKDPAGGRVQDLIAATRPGTGIFSVTDLTAPAR